MYGVIATLVGVVVSMFGSKWLDNHLSSACSKALEPGVVVDVLAQL